MAHGPSQPVERQLCRMLEQTQDDPATDRQLLERFAQQHDEAAFAALVRRHGPLVLSVCRHVLRDPDVAEDVYQATWLVLAQKLRAVAWRDSIAGWLYEVAHRLAHKARTQSARRRGRARPLDGEMAAPTADPHEARWVLDELARLPEKYRAPLVLCYLEGKNHAEAARALNCPLGSMSRRLARGLELLRDRLRQRDRGVGEAGLVAALEYCGVGATGPVTPTGWNEAAAAAAAALASGKATLTALASAAVVSLVQGMVRDMALHQFKFVGAVAVVLLLGGVGLGVLSRYAATAQPPNRPPEARLVPVGQEPAKQPQPPTPARPFASSQQFTVHQIVEGQTHSRRLGSTGQVVGVTPQGQPKLSPPVPVPANAVWYVQYVPTAGFGFGGGAFGAVGGGQNIGNIAGGQNIGNIGGLNLGNPPGGGALGNLGAMPGMPGAAKLTGRDLATLAAELKKTQATGLRLEDVELADDDLATLVKELPTLQILLLYNTKTTDAGVKHLAGLKGLRVLGLEGSEFTDKAVDAAAGLTALDTLRVGGPRYTTKVFSAVGEMKSLRTVRATWVTFDETALGALGKLPALENLEIVGEVTDKHLEPLKFFAALKQVRLHFAKVGATGVEALSKLENLDQLTLDWLWGEDGPGLHVFGNFGFAGGFGFGGGAFGAVGGGQNIGNIAGGQNIGNIGGLNLGNPPGGGAVGNLGGLGALGLPPGNPPVPVSPTTPLPGGSVKEKTAPAFAAGDLRALAGAKKLTSLSLMGKAFGDAEAEALKGCVGLRKLELFAPELTDRGVGHLKDLKAVERLNLCFSKVTPASAATLRGLPNLKTLFVPLMPADPNYKRLLNQFQTALPRVAVQTLSTLPGVEMLGGFTP